MTQHLFRGSNPPLKLLVCLEFLILGRVDIARDLHSQSIMAEKTNFALDGPPQVQKTESAERKVPMKVLCLGYGRTGTMC